MKKPLPPGRRGTVKKSVTGIDTGTVEEINSSSTSPTPLTPTSSEPTPSSEPIDVSVITSKPLPPGRRGTLNKENSVGEIVADTITAIPTKPKDLEAVTAINPSSPSVNVETEGNQPKESIPPPPSSAPPPIPAESVEEDEAEVETEESLRTKALLTKFQNRSTAGVGTERVTTKRRTLLSDLESFTSDFEAKTQVAEQRAEEELIKSNELKIRLAGEEAARRRAEEEARKRAEEEAARKRAEEEEARRRAEEEARKRAEEEEARVNSSRLFASLDSSTSGSHTSTLFDDPSPVNRKDAPGTSSLFSDVGVPKVAKQDKLKQAAASLFDEDLNSGKADSAVKKSTTLFTESTGATSVDDTKAKKATASLFGEDYEINETNEKKREIDFSPLSLHEPPAPIATKPAVVKEPVIEEELRVPSKIGSKNNVQTTTVVGADLKVPTKTGSSNGNKGKKSSSLFGDDDTSFVDQSKVESESKESAPKEPEVIVQPTLIEEDLRIPTRIGGKSDKTLPSLSVPTAVVTTNKSSLFPDAESQTISKTEEAVTLKVPSKIGSIEPTSPSSPNTPIPEPAAIITTTVGDDELRVPSRIGAGKVKSAEKTKSVKIKSEAAEIKDEGNYNDDVEEGTGDVNSLSNIFTPDERRKLTSTQKANWRAKQMDLIHHRKEFHGAVTYLSDGIFSWQMYGSAEAVDEYGNTYTEYLMRCQWGTTFDNLQPWIVAHRYREFDRLDQALKKLFPNMEKNMPKLPKKEFFRSRESAVVSERRSAIEAYMSKIVSSMPTLIRSDTFDQFLTISDRVKGIRNLLNANDTKPLVSNTTQAEISVVSEEESPNVKIVHEKESTTLSNPLSDPFGILSPKPRSGSSANVETGPDWSNMIWTSDEAESYREINNVSALDEYALGIVEDDIRQLVQWIKALEPRDILSKKGKFRNLLLTTSLKWPSLRATGTLGGFDFTLIPRALQAEEDLINVINQYKNLEAIRTIRK